MRRYATDHGTDLGKSSWGIFTSEFKLKLTNILRNLLLSQSVLLCMWERVIFHLPRLVFIFKFINYLELRTDFEICRIVLQRFIKESIVEIRARELCIRSLHICQGF